jgi:hypothetical protein
MLFFGIFVYFREKRQFIEKDVIFKEKRHFFVAENEKSFAQISKK